MNLTWKEAYRVVYGFLDGIWRTVSQEEQELLSELDTFLGGMMLQEDETSTEPGIMDLWHQAVAQVTHGGGWGTLTEPEAYQAMVLFLGRWAEDNSDGTIQGIWQGLMNSGERDDREDWDRAVRKVLDGEFDPYFGLIG